MNSQELKAYLKRQLAMDAEIDPDGWITKNGRHINVNTKTGEVNAGMGGVLNGVKLSGGPKKSGEASKSSSQGSSGAGDLSSHEKSMVNESFVKDMSKMSSKDLNDHIAYLNRAKNDTYDPYEEEEQTAEQKASQKRIKDYSDKVISEQLEKAKQEQARRASGSGKSSSVFNRSSAKTTTSRQPKVKTSSSSNMSEERKSGYRKAMKWLNDSNSNDYPSSKKELEDHIRRYENIVKDPYSRYKEESQGELDAMKQVYKERYGRKSSSAGGSSSVRSGTSGGRGENKLSQEEIYKKGKKLSGKIRDSKLQMFQYEKELEKSNSSSLRSLYNEERKNLMDLYDQQEKLSPEHKALARISKNQLDMRDLNRDKARTRDAGVKRRIDHELNILKKENDKLRNMRRSGNFDNLDKM